MFVLSHPQGNTFATSSTKKQEKNKFDSSGSVLLKNLPCGCYFLLREKITIPRNFVLLINNLATSM